MGGRVFRALALGVLLAIGSLGAAPAQAPAAWPQNGADLKPDPDVVFGTLPNGMRYALQRNPQPRRQVSLRYVILGGSMHEAPDQAGLAHLVEHMAFRGSRNVKDGEVQASLERLGLRMGADTNANTLQNATLYRFDLANGDDASLDQGLRLLREISSELTFDPALVDAERRIVASEERARAGAARDLSEAILAAQLGDHPYARSVIGRPEVIAGAPVQRLINFYRAYYRPERAVLVAAGDFDPAALEAKIKAQFQDWRPVGAPGGEPPRYQARRSAPVAQVKVVPGLPAGQLVIAKSGALRGPLASRAEAIRWQQEAIAADAFTVRLRQLALAEPAAPFRSTNGIRRLRVRNIYDGVALEAGGVENPDAALAFLVKAHRQALQHGLTQDELDQMVNVRRSQMKDQAASVAELFSPGLADRLWTQIVAGEIPRSPTQNLEIFEEAAASLTLEQANAMLRARFEGDEPVIFFGGPAGPAGGEAGLLATYAAAQAAPIQGAFVAPAAKAWPFTDFGPPGKVAERRRVADLAIDFIRFENGVRLTFKAAPNLKDQVLVNLRLEGGALSRPRDRVDSSYASAQQITAGGLKGLTLSELARTRSTLGVVTMTGVQEDAFVLGYIRGPGVSPTRPANLDSELQILAAYLTAPAYSGELWTRGLSGLTDFDRSRAASPQAVFNDQVQGMLRSGDRRWTQPTSAEIARMNHAEAVAFIRPIVESAPLEVVIVGDITVDRAIEAVAKTLGALPPRRPAPREDPGLRLVNFPAPTAQPVVLRHKGRADQSLVGVFWPATGLLDDQKGYQAAAVLADIFRLRATQQIRNREGKTYSPGVAAQFSMALPTYGRIQALVEVAPADAAQAFSEIDAIAADLAANPVSAEELARAVGPRLEAERRTMQDAGSWLTMLAGVQAEPRRLDYIRNHVRDLQAVTAADVQDAARRWLVKDKSWRVQIVPETPAVAAN